MLTIVSRNALQDVRGKIRSFVTSATVLGRHSSLFVDLMTDPNALQGPFPEVTFDLVCLRNSPPSG